MKNVFKVGDALFDSRQEAQAYLDAEFDAAKQKLHDMVDRAISDTLAGGTPDFNGWESTFKIIKNGSSGRQIEVVRLFENAGEAKT
jgi:hypothetical protein